MAWRQYQAAIRALERQQGCRLLCARRGFNAARLAAGGNEEDRAAACEHRKNKRQHRAAARSGNPTAQAAYQFHRLAQQFFDPAQEPRPVHTRDVLGVLQQQQQQAMTSRNTAAIRRLNRLRQFLEANPRMLPPDTPPPEPDVCARLSAPPRPRKRKSRTHRLASPAEAHAEQGRCNKGFVQIACTDMTTQTPFDRSSDERVVQLSDKSCYTAQQLADVWRTKLRPEELTRTWNNATMTAADRQAVVALLARSRDETGRSYLEQVRDGGWLRTTKVTLKIKTLQPTALLLLPDGSLLVGDRTRLHKISAESHAGGMQVSTVAGDGEAGHRDGAAAQARFYFPRSLALLPDGRVLVADSWNHRIRMLSADLQQVSTVAGDGRQGHRDGAAAQARFRRPAGLALLPDGRVLVSDVANHRIRMLSADLQQVSTVAGDEEKGHRDGPAAQARFYFPRSLALLPDGRVLVADWGNHRIRMLSAESHAGGMQVSTVAGDGKEGHRDGAAAQARFRDPRGLALLPDGSVIVTDKSKKLRMLSADLQQVSKLQVFRRSAADCVRDHSKFASCMAVSPEGSLLVAHDSRTKMTISSLGGWFEDSVAMCQRRKEAARESGRQIVVSSLAELTALPPADLEAQLPRFWELLRAADRLDLNLRAYPEIHMARPIAVALWRLAVGPERELAWDEIESRLLPQVEDLSRAWTTDMLEYSEEHGNGSPDQLLRDLVDPETVDEVAELYFGANEQYEQQEQAIVVHNTVLELQG